MKGKELLSPVWIAQHGSLLHLARHPIPPRHARIPVIVKVMRRIARASAALPNILFCGTMRVRRMFVPDIAEEMDAIRARQERCSYRVHRRVAPTLVVETATPVEVLEERSVGFATPKVHIGNLKIAPKVTEVVVGTTIVR